MDIFVEDNQSTQGLEFNHSPVADPLDMPRHSLLFLEDLITGALAVGHVKKLAWGIFLIFQYVREQCPHYDTTK